jgi:hypothetical protein
VLTTFDEIHKLDQKLAKMAASARDVLGGSGREEAQLELDTTTESRKTKQLVLDDTYDNAKMAFKVARGEYVIKRRFQPKRAQR